MDIKDITVGNSWACRFKTTTFLDTDGEPVVAPKLEQGEAHPGTPGEYTSVGIILTRDVVNQRVKVKDTHSTHTFTVEWSDCWDCDLIEWVDTAE